MMDIACDAKDLACEKCGATDYCSCFCGDCGAELVGEAPNGLCRDCENERQGEADALDALEGYGDDDADPRFAGPGSALRAASEDNPRDQPCPQCDRPDQLTPLDVAHGYVCDACADDSERGW